MVATLLSIFSLFNKNMADAKLERTFIAVKPDGVQRGLVGEIVARFEKRGYKLVAGKLVTAPEALLKKHYEDLSGKTFFAGLVKYMASGPIFAMVWEGSQAVKMGRMMLGETNPTASLPGTIRGDYCIDIGRNICHGSDSVETAQREISLWFKDDELNDYTVSNEKWVFE